MEPGLAQWLAGPQGQAALAAARSLAGDDLARSAALRAGGLAPAEAAAVLTQLELAALEAAPPGWLLTRDGLEQGTRPVVARRRGRLLAEAGLASVVDASAGLGFDAAGMAAAGLAVIAVERDPATAALLAHNVPAAQVRIGEAQELVPQVTADAVFIDPARRVPGQRTSDGRRAQSERDPSRWSPPLPWVIGLAATRRIVAKVAPGLRAIPAGWHAEWVSVGRTVVETTLWSFPVIAGRQAVVIADDEAHVIAGGAGQEQAQVGLRAGTVGSHLLEPDPAVIAAGLVPELAAQLGAQALAGSHWLTASVAMSTPFARAYAVDEELPAAPKELRRALRERGITNPTIKSLGTGIDASELRRALRATPGPEAVIVLLRVGDRVRAYRVSPSR